MLTSRLSTLFFSCRARLLLLFFIAISVGTNVLAQSQTGSYEYTVTFFNGFVQTFRNSSMQAQCNVFRDGIARYRPNGPVGTFGTWGPAELIPVDSVLSAELTNFEHPALKKSNSPVFSCQVIPHFSAGCVPGTTGPLRSPGLSDFVGCWNSYDGPDGIGQPENFLSVYLWDVFDASAMPQLVLSGPTETRPAGTGGNSTITLTAKTMSGRSPKPGAAINFSVEVTPNSGGHEHHDISRPKGTLSAVQGTTDANGEVRLTFTAPEVAGIHTVKATCATCSNSAAAKEIQVKVPDLLPISPNPPQNTDGSYVYALTSVDKTHQGNGRYHHNQYYLTEQSRRNLRAMAEAFAAEGWGMVALNDASLFWGGRYDISSNWAGSHKGHRDGREIDISFVRANNPISASKQKVFYDKFCEDKKVSFPFSILHHYVKQPHFHVYLEKQTACFKSEK